MGYKDVSDPEETRKFLTDIINQNIDDDSPVFIYIYSDKTGITRYQHKVSKSLSVFLLERLKIEIINDTFEETQEKGDIIQ